MPKPTVTYEQSILGAILIDAACLGQVLTQVRQEDFNTPTYRTIFQVIQKLFNDGTPVDPVTVLHAGAGAYDASLLAQLMEVTPTAANVLHHCRALKEANTLNRLADLGLRLADERTDLEAARGLASDINGLLVERQSVGISTAKEAAHDFLQRHDPNAPKPEYIPLGFAPLEKAVRVSLGDFLVLGGLPSSGKTLMCLQMALAMARKYRVGLFSFETSREKLTDRLIAHLASLPLYKIQKNDLSNTDWEAVAQATTRLSSLPLDIISAAGMRIDDVQAMALSRRYQVIIIDYLQLVATAERDRYTAVTKISMQVHTMCQRHGIACLGLSQLARPEKQKGKPVPPDMSSLRESGQLEQDADMVILLYHSDPNDNKSDRVVKVAKNKEGERTRFYLCFNGATQTFYEPPAQYYDRIRREIYEAGKTKPPEDKTAAGETAEDWVQAAINAEPLPF